MLNKLRGLALSALCEFVNFDIQGFSMSGAHDVLSNSCAKFFEESERSILLRGLLLCLRNQFVSLQFDQRHYQCVEGTGMGSVMSD